VAELPKDVSALRDASSELVFHYRGGGDYAENGVPEERVREIDTRYDRFLTGPDAWRESRNGTLDHERFVVHPELPEPFLRSWPYLTHNLVLDLAALGSREMVLWDEYGLLSGPISETDRGLLDELAGEISDTVDPELVGSWLHIEPLRIPEELTSYSPTSGPQQVTLRPGLAT